MIEQKTCKQEIQKHFRGRMQGIEKLWKKMQKGDDTAIDDFNNYGLCFEYVGDEKQEPFFQWQLSTGGPGDEFRFFADHHFNLYKIEYIYLDWFSGVTKVVRGKAYEMLAEIWQNEFVETETAKYARDNANE